MKKYCFEICANSVESCVAAQAGGADRVELCAGIPEGGTTPSCGDIATARELLTTTRLHVIIRPRGGDFLYSPIEQRIMLKDIETARNLGADGVVFGCLTPEGDIDRPLMEQLMKAAQGMSVTFHRAFDVCRDPHRALEQIIALGCDRLLTSGQQATAEAGAGLIARLVEQAAGRIIVMPGSGIRPSNIAAIERVTRATEFHSTARGAATDDGMRYRNPSVSFAADPAEEHVVRRSDRSVVSQLVNDVA